MSTLTLPARVHALRLEAQHVISVELRPADPAQSFPVVEAGAHVDLHLGQGLVRSYSLTNPGETSRYVLGVLNDPQSRGGSRFVHERLRIGQVLELSPPRNHFRLAEDAPHSVLLAGGIGITPLLAMLRRLAALGRPAHLVYCARSRREAAFVEEIAALAGAAQGLQLTLRWDDEAGGPPELASLLAGHPAETHFYCCGPGRMIDAFEAACETLGYAHVHVERFAAAPVEPGGSEQECTVELRRSGRSIRVPAGVSLLEALEAAGCAPSFSCREGICGACETRVLAGDIDHRDHILTKEERAANRSMMLCVSQCRSSTLVLDM